MTSSKQKGKASSFSAGRVKYWEWSLAAMSVYDSFS